MTFVEQHVIKLGYVERAWKERHFSNDEVIGMNRIPFLQCRVILTQQKGTLSRYIKCKKWLIEAEKHQTISAGQYKTGLSLYVHTEPGLHRGDLALWWNTRPLFQRSRLRFPGMVSFWVIDYNL